VLVPDEIEDLVDAGVALHWLHPRSKRPVGNEWSRKPRSSIAELRAAHREGYNLGARLGEMSRCAGGFLHCIDLDIRDPARGDEARETLSTWLPGFDQFPAVVSGSGGESRHIYFLAARPLQSRKLAHSADKITDAEGREHWAWEIDLLANGKQVVLPPSIHPTGKPYRWLQPFGTPEIDGLAPLVSAETVESWAPIGQVKSADLAELEDDDAALLAALRDAPADLTATEVREILDLLPLAEWCEDRDGWLKVGMALSHQFRGGEEGFELWTAFSRQSAKFDARNQRQVWKSFSNKPGGIRFATLLKAAQAERARRAADAVEIEELIGDPSPVPTHDLEPLKGPGGDIQAGREFACRHLGRLVYVQPGGFWRHWDGVRWSTCLLGEELEAAKAFAAEWMQETTRVYAHRPTEPNKARQKDATDLFRSAHRVRAMMSMAATERGIVVRLDAFDRDPMQLGVGNGVLCLRRGVVLPASPEQMNHRHSRATFDPTAAAPLWTDFLARIQPCEAVRSFLQRAVGYTLTGSVDEERLFFLHGVGANGKSVFANVINALLGDFAVTVGSKLLTKSHNSGEADRLVGLLPGARLALANETGQGDVWDDQRVKELVSREMISARKLYAEPFEFMPTHKLWIRGNHLPGAHDAGDGFWRRLVPIAFPVAIPEPERVPDLDRRIIETELSGVLNWAMAGCQAWQSIGLAVPAELERETNKYRDETDLLGMWLEENVERDASGWLPVAHAFGSFRSFCVEQNVRAPSQAAFSRQMTARDLGASGGRKNGRRIRGLRLRDPFDDLNLQENSKE
jgi:putative DNA primase/helicase